jgi:hypothetical protein
MSRYTKIGADGATLPADATDHIAVMDTTTGLMWSASDVGGTPDDREINHDDAEKACAELNLAGHADWRLPTPHELFGLVDHARHRPAIDTDAFPSCASDWYWSGCRLAADPDYAWVVNFHHGGVSHYHRDDYARVRAVRVASAPPRQ